MTYFQGWALVWVAWAAVQVFVCNQARLAKVQLTPTSATAEAALPDDEETELTFRQRLAFLSHAAPLRPHARQGRFRHRVLCRAKCIGCRQTVRLWPKAERS